MHHPVVRGLAISVMDTVTGSLSDNHTELLHEEFTDALLRFDVMKECTVAMCSNIIKLTDDYCEPCLKDMFIGEDKES